MLKKKKVKNEEKQKELEITLLYNNDNYDNDVIFLLAPFHVKHELC